MSKYVDGFVIAIKKKNLKGYKKMAQLGLKVWKEHGALDYYECMADDYAKWGLGFPKLCKLKSDEVAMFSFITYKTKAHRNKVNKAVMKDPRMHMEGFKMPFEEKRFSMAGFKTIVTNK